MIQSMAFQLTLKNEKQVFICSPSSSFVFLQPPEVYLLGNARESPVVKIIVNCQLRTPIISLFNLCYFSACIQKISSLHVMSLFCLPSHGAGCRCGKGFQNSLLVAVVHLNSVLYVPLSRLSTKDKIKWEMVGQMYPKRCAAVLWKLHCTLFVLVHCCNRWEMQSPGCVALYFLQIFPFRRQFARTKRCLCLNLGYEIQMTALCLRCCFCFSSPFLSFLLPAVTLE